MVIAIVMLGIVCLCKNVDIPYISNALFYIKCTPLDIYDTLKGPTFSAGISASVEDATNIYLNTIDDNILKEYDISGGKISIVPQEFFSTCNLTVKGISANEIAGGFDGSSKDIFISEESSKWQSTILHEFGHYLSSTYEIANTTEFKELENRESLGLAKLNAYVTTSTEEYFAEAFSYYMVYPTELRYVAPDTYCYIDNKYTELCEELCQTNIR